MKRIRLSKLLATSYLLRFIFVIILCQPAYSVTRDKYLYYTDVDGLPRNIVTSIEQDEFGYTWIGTRSGIARFNGYSFKIYEELQGQIINQLLIDSKNNLWISAYQGLFLYNRTNDEFELKRLGYTNQITEFLGEIYLGNNKDVIKLNAPDTTISDQNNNISAFCFTNRGIYLGTEFKGVKLISENATNKNVLEGKPISVIREIDENVYIGCSNGELFVHQSNGQLIEVDIHNHTNIKEIIKVDDKIWLATDGNGIVVIDKELNITQVLKRENISKFKSNSIYDLYLGINNEVWVATYGSGLLCLKQDDAPFQNIQPEPGTPNSLVAQEGVFASQEGAYFYFGTNYGLSIWEENTGVFTNLKTTQLQAELRGTKVMATLSDEDKNLWIATYDGLLGQYNSDLKLIQTFHPCGNNEKEMQRIIFLHQYNKNNLLIGTHYNNRTLLNFNLKTKEVTPFSIVQNGNYLSNFDLMSIRENREGDLMVLARYDGLFRVNFQNKILENSLQGLNNRITFQVYDFYEDTKGYYWLATFNNGLVRMSKDGQEFDKWTTEEGLPTNTLLRIESTDDKFLWIATIAGLCRFEMETGNVFILNHEHGLAANEFTERASAKTDDGRLIFGSSAGFTILNPEKVEIDSSEAQVIISDINFYNQSIKTITDKPILTSPLENTREISLSYNRNSFTIHFFAKDMDLPKYNNYAYRLKGLKNDWIYMGERNSATYTNLSPGEYTFEVKCTNKSNVWSEKPTQLIINISPPWYLSWIALTSYLILASATILFIMHFFISRTKLRRDIELSEFKVQTEHELTEKKLAFFTNVSHDLKTPLTLIDAPVNELLQSDRFDAEEKDKLLIIKRNSQRLYKLIAQLLDFRKLSNKQLPLKVSQANITNLIENIYQSFSKEFRDKSIDFERSSTLKENIFFDSKIIEMILWNLLSNALKFTEKEGDVYLSAEEEIIDNKRHLKLTVKDTGIGIPADEQDEIFNRFYQSEKNVGNARKGTGIGLSIVKELVELHHGSLLLESKAGIGSTFTITVPAEQNMYASAEVDLKNIDNSIMPTQVNDTELVKTRDSNMPGRYNLTKILLVEDNQDLREYMVSFFEKYHRVYSASDGVKGLKLAKEKNPDIIVTDIMMPNMNGYDFCKEIRNGFETSHIPVIMLTSNSETEHQIKGLTMGADAYITKPFAIELLQASVYTILENRSKLRNRFLGIEKSEEDKNTLSQKDIKLINDIKLFIDENIANQNLSVEMLADHLKISRTQLNRKIKSLTGQTPNNLIKSIRLKKAYSLLKEEEVTVSEASYKVGFNDPNYFTICFSKEFGKNPSKV